MKHFLVGAKGNLTPYQQKLWIICLLIIFGVSLGFAQQPYKIPFASKDNSIELTIENGSAKMTKEVKVTVSELPKWIRLSAKEQTIDELKPNKEKASTFVFSVDKSAPVNKEQVLKFVVSAPSGESWTKQIKVTIAPPDHFELLQNFPNPFNPSTTISYLLPYSSQVDIRIYNILGQEIATLATGEQEAGYHEELWNASSVPSGVFFSQLAYVDEKGVRHVERKKMMLLK